MLLFALNSRYLVNDLISVDGELRVGLSSQDPAIRKAAESRLEKLLLAHKARGVDVAKLSTAFAALFVGYDADEMNTAVGTGVNAAENNAFWFVLYAVVKAADFANQVYDTYQLYVEFRSDETTEERKQEIAEEIMLNGALSAIGAKPAKLLFDKIEKIFGESKDAILRSLEKYRNGSGLEAAGGPRWGGRDYDRNDDPNLYSRNESNSGGGSSGFNAKLPRLSGNNWKFDSKKDIDLRGTDRSYRDGLELAFERTGIPKDQFTVTKWGKDINGKSVPTEYSGPNGASVNMDIPELNNVKSNGTLGEGPHQPHIGYQTPGKGKNRVRGHIFTDYIPATRR